MIKGDRQGKRILFLKGRSHRHVGWVERINIVEKTAQFDCLSETQHPHALYFVGFRSVNPTYNLIDGDRTFTTHTQHPTQNTPSFILMW